MNSELYEYLAMQFYHDNKDHRHYNYLSHGLKEEVDEVINATTDDETIEELGDVLWYVTAIAHKMGVSLETLMKENYYKLERRQLVGKKQ
jgi:NTP pyrophosphatase (non-canonical NTP hydrolase)